MKRIKNKRTAAAVKKEIYCNNIHIHKYKAHKEESIDRIGGGGCAKGS
jgi:hypothetical protein